MQLGMVGLGRMGANMTERLPGGGHQVVVFDLSPEAVKRVGAGAAGRLAGGAGARGRPPSAVWIMVPTGDPDDEVTADWRPTSTRATR